MSLVIDRAVFDRMTQNYLEARARAAAEDLSARVDFPVRAEGASVVIGPGGVLAEYGDGQTPSKPWVHQWLAGMKG